MDDMLRTYLEENNGFYRIADARALGVSKGRASGFVKELGLSKVAHGVYCSEEACIAQRKLGRTGFSSFSFEIVSLSFHMRQPFICTGCLTGNQSSPW